MTQIGFVGLGHMGLPMASNLVKAGFRVTGFDINCQALETFRANGGLVAQSLRELAENDVLITMLQTGAQVQEVCLGEQGLFALSKNALFIDCSSIDVSTTQTLHQAAQQYGLQMVDAPVSGGVAGAQAASLTCMVGGDEPVFLKAKEVLSRIGKTIIYTGKAGTGQAAKICNNMILGISMIAISEAFTLAQGLGLSPQKLFEVVNHASGQCWAMSHYVPLPGILDNVPANCEYQPGFTAAMMLKDLQLSQNSAAAVHVNTILGEQATKIYQRFTQQHNANLDFSAIIKLLGQDKNM